MSIWNNPLMSPSPWRSVKPYRNELMQFSDDHGVKGGYWNQNDFIRPPAENRHPFMQPRDPFNPTGPGPIETTPAPADQIDPGSSGGGGDSFSSGFDGSGGYNPWTGAGGPLAGWGESLGLAGAGQQQNAGAGSPASPFGPSGATIGGAAGGALSLLTGAVGAGSVGAGLGALYDLRNVGNAFEKITGRDPGFGVWDYAKVGGNGMMPWSSFGIGPTADSYAQNLGGVNANAMINAGKGNSSAAEDMILSQQQLERAIQERAIAAEKERVDELYRGYAPPAPVGLTPEQVWANNQMLILEGDRPGTKTEWQAPPGAMATWERNQQLNQEMERPGSTAPSLTVQEVIDAIAALGGGGEVTSNDNGNDFGWGGQDAGYW